MKSLAELVRSYQRVKTLEARLRFAEAVVCRVGPAMQNYIARRLHPDMVEDACQETLIAIATGLEKITANTDQRVWSWCYRIASNKIVDQRRAAGKHAALPLDLSEIELGLEAAVREESIPSAERLDLNDTLQLLRAVNPPCADLLWERYVQDLSYEEIAQFHDWTYDAARMAVTRATESARELMAKTR